MSGQGFTLIGPGKVGLAISRRLCHAGYSLRAIAGTANTDRAMVEAFLGTKAPLTTAVAELPVGGIMLIATPDDCLATVATELHRQGRTDASTLIIHFSGLYPAQCLLNEAPQGCRALSLHPLMTFPSAEAGYAALPGTVLAVEGEAAILAEGEKIATALGAQPFRLPGDKKALYHAAAVVSCNYSIAVAAAGRDLLQGCGLDKQQAWEMLLPLMRQTWDNLTTMEPETALTGPIARGDSATIENHLEALPADLQPLYRALALEALKLTRLSTEKRQALAELLQSANTR